MIPLEKEDVEFGVPLKTKERTDKKMDSREMRIGYQLAMLENERSQFEKEKAEQAAQAGAILEQLMNAQAQMATMQGAQAGATAGLSSGLGLGGIPVAPNGAVGLPPMGGPPPGMPPMGGPPPGMPPMM